MAPISRLWNLMTFNSNRGPSIHPRNKRTIELSRRVVQTEKSSTQFSFQYLFKYFDKSSALKIMTGNEIWIETCWLLWLVGWLVIDGAWKTNFTWVNWLLLTVGAKILNCFYFISRQEVCFYEPEANFS